MGRPKRRRLGQHFLADRRVAERIVGLLGEQPPRVLEIGPGRGALTELLLARFERVLALELDPALASALGERFAGSALELCVADALHDPIDPLLAGEARWQVAANLPYSVGSAIVRRLLPRHDLIERMVVMLQREVAERLVAEPGDRHHGLLALERAAWAEAEIIFHVGPGAFRPRPRVVSSVLVLELRPARHPGALLEQALALAAHALRRPRKMLSNAVAPLVGPERLRAAGLDPAARPGLLPLDDWVALARSVEGPGPSAHP
jgi:16S rRNA (adenine1518-N6/adenine1519-N6)-dimethyltransferase